MLVLGLGLGCQEPPSQLGGSEGSSSGPPPASTTADTTSVGDGTTMTPGSSGGSGPSSSGSADEGSSSRGDEGSSGEPVDDPLGPFEAPVAVDTLNSGADDDDPTLTEDLLEIYFASTRDGSEDVFVAIRGDVRDDWDAPEPVDALNSPAQETFPEVSPDELVMLLASNRPGASGFDLYVSRRDDRDMDWSEPVPIGDLNTPMDDFGATPTPSLTSVFLCRADPPGGLGQADVLRATIDLANLMVQPPELVLELSSPQADCSVSVSSSEREIFLESTRPATMGGWNLWTATRDEASDAWGEPVEVEAVNSNSDDVDPWLSIDRRTLFFASTRDGNYDLFMTERR